jgi:multiple sugar transport system ATP-binding protein
MTLADRLVVMHEGSVVQEGRPEDVFSRPASRFVAGFLGTPSMNFIEGEVIDGRFNAPGLSLPLPGVATGKASIGVRPHDVRVSDDGGLVGEVVMVEPMGWEAFAHIRTAAGNVVTRLEGRLVTVRAGDRLTLAVDPACCHFFAADGKTIVHAQSSHGPA